MLFLVRFLLYEFFVGAFLHRCVLATCPTNSSEGIRAYVHNHYCMDDLVTQTNLSMPWRGFKPTTLLSDGVSTHRGMHDHTAPFFARILHTPPTTGSVIHPFIHDDSLSRERTFFGYNPRPNAHTASPASRASCHPQGVG